MSGDEIVIQLKGAIKDVLAKPGVGGDVFEYGVSFSDVTNEVRTSLEQYISEVSEV